MAYVQGADSQRDAGAVGIVDYRHRRLGDGFYFQVSNERGLSRLRFNIING